MQAHALAQVEPPAVGIHLMWAGPRSWLYSPRGWFIQRRKARRDGPKFSCEELTASHLIWLRQVHVLPLTLGEYTLRSGNGFDGLVPGQPPGSFGPGECEVITLELTQPRDRVRVEATAKLSFVYALRDGKVVATASKVGTGVASFDLAAFGIDTVVLYALAPDAARFCALTAGAEDDWKNEPYLVKELQLPLRELMPGLGDADAEFAEAKSRLLPGEDLERADFERLTESLRTAIRGAGPARPLDLTLLLRDDTKEDFEELSGLDPIRILLSHPKWRRVLGFGFFDGDPSLVPGEAYEYRITGWFPGADLVDAVYGFHTVPSQTAIPADFFLRDIRVRLPQPARVERGSDVPDVGRARLTRRGIHLRPRDQHFWLVPSLLDWSAVIDFPSPVSAVLLEVEPDQALEFAAGDPADSFVATDPVPPGPRPRLNFATPITQLRLRGKAFLQALRIPVPAPDWTEVFATLPAVALADAPRPEPPLLASVANLQKPESVSESDQPQAGAAPRQALGFEVTWRPAPMGGLMQWAATDPPPPLDAALFEIEHREAGSGGFTPVLPDENWTFGNRDEAIDETAPFPGADLLQLFPESRQPGPGLDCHFRDVFDFKEGGGEVNRPPPPPGTLHQYRVRSVDAIGRPSLSWRETGTLRLEKRAPPPVPVGPSETPADQVSLPEPMGVHARLLVQEAPDLTAAEQTLLGSDANAIVLRWGWHAQQREQDPFAREFRVYVTSPLDAVSAQITSVTELGPGRYSVMLVLARSVSADAAKGLRLTAGRSFRIESHTGGTSITAIVTVHVPGPDGALPEPSLGPLSFPLRLSPHLTRGPAWSERFAVVPITAATAYEIVIRNRLELTADHPRDTIWVGVSAADDQSYVPDPLSPAETRPGNEGAIAPVIVAGRYHGRPVFDVPPSLDPVPSLIGPEPLDRPSRFELDLAPYLIGTGLAPGDRIRPERVAADTVLAACFATPDGRVMGRVVEGRPGEVEAEIVVPNPGDRATVVAALESGQTASLDDRFVVFLAGSHPYRDRLFAAATPESVPHARFIDVLAPQAGRYVYRVRRSDAAGHLSVGGAVARVIVRVPQPTVPAPPEKLSRESADPPGILKLTLPSDPELSHVLVFQQIAAYGEKADGGELLRIPNRPDLHADGIRLRTPDGELLAPATKDLSDADVVLDAEGQRHVTLTFSAAAGEIVRVWTCSLSRDGVPSRIGGPWSVAMPVAPLTVPALAVVGALPTLSFSWSWPAGEKHTVALQRSSDGRAWTRISPLLAISVTGRVHLAESDGWRYRLLVMSPDGRTAPSNTVEP